MSNIITIQLLADDGSAIEQECTVIGVFDALGADYIALAPTDDARTVLIYGYRQTGADAFELLDIEDETTYRQVVTEFNRILSEADL